MNKCNMKIMPNFHGENSSSKIDFVVGNPRELKRIRFYHIIIIYITYKNIAV